MAPYINRFIQPDTLVPNPTNPQSWNRYSYVRNNPINFIDPSGHGRDCGLGMGCVQDPESGSLPLEIDPPVGNGGGNVGDNNGNHGDLNEFCISIDGTCDVQSTVFLPIEGGGAGQFTDVEWELLISPWGWPVLFTQIGHNITQFTKVYLGAGWWQEPSATLVGYSKYADLSSGPRIGSMYTSIDGLTIVNNFNEPINTVNIDVEYDHPSEIYYPDKVTFTGTIPPNSVADLTDLGKVPDGITITMNITMYTENYYGRTTHVISP